MGQLGLFGSEIEPLVTEEERALAARVPTFVRFGTSSWSFPGWKGILWKGAPSEAALARSGLQAYASHPLLRTVGLDRSHYAPLRDEDLAEYAAQLDAAGASGSFKVVSKVWSELTTATKPGFLDPERFVSDVLGPYERTFTAYAGPFVFQLAPMPPGMMTERELARKLTHFLERVPTTFRYAFELRNSELFGTTWIDALRAHGAAHVFNYWTAMPRLTTQLSRGKHLSSFLVVRLMLPPFARYETKKAEFAPFDKIVQAQPEMREDVVHILRAAEGAGCEDAFVLVNNKAEGSSPLTIRELASLVAS